jgi:hypothetical protein
MQVPVVAKFLKARKDGRDDDLSIDDLTALAEYLKERTIRFTHDTFVGGPTQLAIFQDGKVSINQQSALLDAQSPRSFDVLEGGHLGPRMSHPGITSPVEGGVKVPPQFGALITDALVSNIVQPLDNIVFSHNHFENCILTYEGSPMAIFDSSNTVSDCKLYVSSDVPIEAPFLKMFKRDFPSVDIITHPIPRPGMWTLVMVYP